MTWWESAACRHLPTNLFFLERWEQGTHQAAAEACLDCPVYAECFDWAIVHELEGYWAGTTPEARRRIRRAQNISYRRPVFQFAVNE
jgi:hypothetical protein